MTRENYVLFAIALFIILISLGAYVYENYHEAFVYHFYGQFQPTKFKPGECIIEKDDSTPRYLHLVIGTHDKDYLACHAPFSLDLKYWYACRWELEAQDTNSKYKRIACPAMPIKDSVGRKLLGKDST